MQCGGKHHDEKGTWVAFSARTTSQQPRSVLAPPGEPRSHLTACWARWTRGGRLQSVKMRLWWTLLFGFWSVCGELPFIAENNAAMLVNW